MHKRRKVFVALAILAAALFLLPSLLCAMHGVHHGGCALCAALYTLRGLSKTWTCAAPMTVALLWAICRKNAPGFVFCGVATPVGKRVRLND